MVANAIYNKSYQVKRRTKYIFPEEQNRILKVFFGDTATSFVDNSKIGIYENIEQIYNECKNDGWEIEGDCISKGIIENSYLQVKNFIPSIDGIQNPTVVPFFNGLMGLCWGSQRASISIIFKGNGYFSYSIVTDTSNDVGTVKQTEREQYRIIKMISEVL